MKRNDMRGMRGAALLSALVLGISGACVRAAELWPEEIEIVQDATDYIVGEEAFSVLETEPLEMAVSEEAWQDAFPEEDLTPEEYRETVRSEDDGIIVEPEYPEPEICEEIAESEENADEMSGLEIETVQFWQDAEETYISDTVPEEDVPEAGIQVETELQEGTVLAGECGVQPGTVYWNLDESGVLHITGIGAMRDFENAQQAPWHALYGDVQKIAVEEGVTSVGAYAFCEAELEEDVSIAQSVETVGEFAFSSCGGLKTVTIG